jgi:RNA polymerase sigma-B factor
MTRPAWSGEPDALLIRRWQEDGDTNARDMVIERYDRLIRALAHRFTAWGEPFDDLVQVAWVAALKCMDRFDPDRGIQFSSYLTPFVVGELRRYFRDKVSAVHIPRPVLELRTRVNRAIEELTRTQGASPSIPQLAEYLEVSVEDVLEAVQSDRARIAVSLSPAPEDEDDGRAVPAEEIGYDQVDASLAVASAVHVLDDRDRAILHLRFEEGLSQSAIASRMGISQMHVSRLLRRACEKLRTALHDSEDAIP